MREKLLPRERVRMAINHQRNQESQYQAMVLSGLIFSMSIYTGGWKLARVK